MQNTYFIISLIMAGIALATGISILTFGLLQDKEKEYFIFGIMCLLLAIFILMPPTGFIVYDKAPYPLQIEIKRIFVFLYYGLTPLFIIHYSGYRKLWFFRFFLILTLVCYIMMIQTKIDSKVPHWFWIAQATFLIINVFGIFSGFWQLKHGKKKDAYYLLGSMAVYTILFIINISHQFFGSYIPITGELKFYFPFHFNSVAFMLIMGIRLFEKTYDKLKLEKLLLTRNTHWNEFMRKAPLLVLELDYTGNVRFINEYGLNLLGYVDLDDLKGKNWLEHCIPEEEQKWIRNVFNATLEGKQENPYHKNFILTKDHQKLIVNWVNYVVDSDNTLSKTVVCIGQNMTEEEEKNKMLERLKLEIEKEHMVADLIHSNSSRNDKPFIKVNCGALPKELIEDELFGHEKGAFTSAIAARKGRFELADGGTIFLDEIGELPLEMQPKLLRVLQNGQFERVGGQITIQVDVQDHSCYEQKPENGNPAWPFQGRLVLPVECVSGHHTTPPATK